MRVPYKKRTVLYVSLENYNYSLYIPPKKTPRVTHISVKYNNMNTHPEIFLKNYFVYLHVFTVLQKCFDLNIIFEWLTTILNLELIS